MTVAVVGAAVCSVVVSAVACLLIVRYARALGLVDVPNLRSSHLVPTPRGGGVGVVLGLLAGLGLLAAGTVAPGHEIEIVLVGFVVIAALGLVDDLRSVPALYRLLAQSLVSIAVVIVIGGIDRIPLPSPFDLPLGILAAPAAVVWLVAMTNFYNFMDGINGLAGGQCIASCVGMSVAGFASATTDSSLLLGAASLGFVVLNFPVARIFLGDVGSTSIGFLLAGLPMTLPSATARPMAIFAVGVGLTLFILDPLETLVRRARAGHLPGLAHRQHNYQRIADQPERRTRTAVVLVVTGLVLALAGAAAYRTPMLGWPVAAVAIVAFALEVVVSRRHVESGSRERQRV